MGGGEPEKRRRGRPPASCGTPAAYRRHLRKGEKPCLPCTRAHSAANRKNEERPVLAVVGPPAPVVPDVLDVVEDARANLALVIAAMEGAPASAMGPLSRRRQELVALITDAQNAGEEQEDEFTKARLRRGARAEN